MTPWVSLILIAVMAMTPGMREAFGEIVKAQIESGIVDFRDDGRARIEAIGVQHGVTLRFNCYWLGGRPVIITKWALKGKI